MENIVANMVKSFGKGTALIASKIGYKLNGGKPWRLRQSIVMYFFHRYGYDINVEEVEPFKDLYRVLFQRRRICHYRSSPS